LFWTAVRKDFLARSSWKRFVSRAVPKKERPASAHVSFVEGGVMAKKQLLEDMRAEPTRFFRAPGDVLRDRRFSDAERLEILLAWERLASATNNEGHDVAVLNAVCTARQEVERRLAGSRNLGSATTN
jgi:hypothetical protein